MLEQQIAPPERQTASLGWPDWQKQIVAVILLLLIPLGLYFLRPVLPSLIMTFVATFVLMYPIRWLQRLKLSYQISAILVYFLFLLLSLAAIIWFMIYAVTSLIDTVQNTRAFVEQIFAGATGGTEGGLSGLLNLDFLQDGLAAMSVVGAGISLVSDPGAFVAQIVNRLSRFTSFVSNYGFFIVLLLFFLLEWPRTIGIVGRTLPDNSRREYAILIKRMVGLGESYLLGSLLIVLFYWVVAALLFFVSGVPHPLILGLIVAIPNFIPQGGGLVSAIFVFVFSLAIGSETFLVNRLIFAFIEMAIFMLISGVAYYFVDTKIYSKSVNVPVWIILVGIMVFGAVFGVIGLFVAAAVVAMLGEALGFTLKKMRGEDPYPGQPEPPLFLSKDELAALDATPAPDEEAPAPNNQTPSTDVETPTADGDAQTTEGDTESADDETAPVKDEPDTDETESKT